ncbi:hypothetical protein [Rubrivivax rivuli]|uniref:Uncharacterized protein n=1 Tax=Rubrivivax rivuli TaxID=1862385 RepID=A0A437RD29_9BURK|nr:hypothetical protein [Rubrivivax rivuli]RVU44655.1 hypothetical protein EOE66_18575 [Rubrivivax rivuli]
MSHLASPSAFADTELLPPPAFAAARPAEGGTGTAPSAGAEAQARRAALAIAVVPPAVLLGLLAVVAGLIEPATGMALFATGMAWLVYEMHRYLRRVEAELETALQPGPWG